MGRVRNWDSVCNEVDCDPWALDPLLSPWNQKSSSPNGFQGSLQPSLHLSL